MAKTKADWIKEINEFGAEALGEVTQEDLAAMNIGQLKLLKIDLEKETGKKDEPAAEAASGEEPTSGFVSMCSNEFDPMKTGSCYKQCSKDFPEAFAACLENFKVKPTAAEKKTRVATGAGKTVWNHVANSQAGKIDECIISGKPMSLKEIAEFATAQEPRTLAHLQHLVFDWKVDILVATRKVGEKDEKIYFWSEKDKRRSGDKLAGKSAYPAAKK